MLKRLLLVILIGALGLSGFWWLTQRPAVDAPPALSLAGASDPSGFARAFEPRAFAFPQDHGPHFEYQTEWWYYTGHLTADNGEVFGYQLTFFRRGLTPGAPPAEAGLATNQIYFAHFALTDVSGQRHTFAERFSRGAAGLAGASAGPFGVWLENWSVESLNPDGSEVRLRAQEGDLSLDLNLRATKPVVAHGDQGLSQKSNAPGNASYYLSYTRMATAGHVLARGQTLTVKGESWFDHEWSTSALGNGVVGWDWFSLQLSDGREVMFYGLRRADGALESVSGGTLVEADGTTRQLLATDVVIETRAEWRSPVTDANYPARWHLSIPSAQIKLDIEPWLAEQEMRVSFAYWEGAVRFTGTSQGEAITGNGYIELTGYVSSMEAVF